MLSKGAVAVAAAVGGAIMARLLTCQLIREVPGCRIWLFGV